MTKTDKEIIIDIFQEKLDKEIKSIKGYALAKMLSEELELLLERFKKDELTVDELCQRWQRVLYDYASTALHSVKGMADDLNKGWRRR